MSFSDALHTATQFPPWPELIVDSEAVGRESAASTAKVACESGGRLMRMSRLPQPCQSQTVALLGRLGIFDQNHGFQGATADPDMSCVCAPASNRTRVDLATSLRNRGENHEPRSFCFG